MHRGLDVIGGLRLVAMPVQAEAVKFAKQTAILQSVFLPSARSTDMYLLRKAQQY